MREIKFILTVVRENGFVFSSPVFTLWDFENGNVNTWRKRNSAHNDNEVKIREFTGLLDKNGKEVYEGDYCKGYLDNKIQDTLIDGVVEYSNWGYWIGSYPAVLYELEIIGNIYENPELLK